MATSLAFRTVLLYLTLALLALNAIRWKTDPTALNAAETDNPKPRTQRKPLVSEHGSYNIRILLLKYTLRDDIKPY